MRSAPPARESLFACLLAPSAGWLHACSCFQRKASLLDHGLVGCFLPTTHRAGAPARRREGKGRGMGGSLGDSVLLGKRFHYYPTNLANDTLYLIMSTFNQSFYFDLVA